MKDVIGKGNEKAVLCRGEGKPAAKKKERSYAELPKKNL